MNKSVVGRMWTWAFKNRALIAAAAAVVLIPVTGSAEPQNVFTRVIENARIERDGSTNSLSTVELRIGSDADGKAQGQQSVTYSPSLETIEIVIAETRKKDGRIISVDLAAIQERLTPAAQNATQFDDRKARIVVFPDLAEGDTLALSVRRRSLKSLFPNNYARRVALPRSIRVDLYELTLDMPSDMKIRSDLHNLNLKTAEQDGRTITTITANDLAPDTALHGVSSDDRGLRGFLSTYETWDDYGRAIASLLTPKLVVTPEISAMADEITRNTADRREQTRLIYEWVSTHVRYVNVILGLGGFEPHPAAEILAARYGDCKDHVVLFNTLLAAKGIPAEAVLLNLAPTYSLPGVPTPTFDHLISYLPEWDMYADTTAETVAFGELAFMEYGKPAIHLISKGQAARTTPVLLPQTASAEMKTVATLDPKGVMTGTTETTTAGPFSATLRNYAARAQIDPNAGTTRLRDVGHAGTGTIVRADPKTLTSDFKLVGSFKLDARPEYLDGNAFSPITGMRFIARPADYLTGNLYERRMALTETIPCWSGRQVEDISVVLPANRKIERLPRSITLEAAGLSYKSVWRWENQTVSVRREFTSVFDKALCGPDVRRAIAPTLEAIRIDLGRQVALADE